jgi:putative aldouronate transport system substrate-binding protein
MKRTKYLIFSALLITTLAATMLTGCKSKEQVKDSANTQSESSEIKPFTLTYWVSLPSALQGVVTNYDQTEIFKELQKRTGVTVKFTHPTKGQESEQFGLMLATQQLPDVIEYSMYKYAGGPQKAINDKVIVPLNDYMKYMPNLSGILAENKDLNKQIKTDEGKYYSAPTLQIDPFLWLTKGIVMRKDWLDELGLQAPTTIDEWHDVLTQFKTKKGATAPLLGPIGELETARFLSPFGLASSDFYLDDKGQLQFGATQPGYKEFLTTMNKWFKEGLIDPDFAITDSKSFDSKVTTGKAGAYIVSLNGGMGRYLDLTRKDNPTFDLVGVQIPTLKKGDVPYYGATSAAYRDGGNLSITTSNKNPIDTAKWIDYAYGKEGHMLFNFGVEGVTYTMENGKPKYTDLITKHEGGMTKSLAIYTRASVGGPFDQDPEYLRQYLGYPQKQEAAVKTWSNYTKTDQMPYLTYTTEESTSMADISTTISTRVREMSIKFIMGQESLNNFDKYVKELNDLGLKDMIAVKKAAYERFQNRK